MKQQDDKKQASPLYSRHKQEQQDKQAAKQLLEHLLHGNSENARKMFIANPSLLFIEVSEYAGVTPYRAVLSRGDVEMLKEMEPHFDRVENGKQIAITQLEQQFPAGFAYPPSRFNFNALAVAITNDNELIETGKANEATKALLTQFREATIPDISTGHSFNINILTKALEVYSENMVRWNMNQLSLFHTQIISYLGQMMPVEMHHIGIYGQTAQPPLAPSSIFFSDEKYFPLNVDKEGGPKKK